MVINLEKLNLVNINIHTDILIYEKKFGNRVERIYLENLGLYNYMLKYFYSNKHETILFGMAIINVKDSSNEDDYIKAREVIEKQCSVVLLNKYKVDNILTEELNLMISKLFIEKKESMVC